MTSEDFNLLVRLTDTEVSKQRMACLLVVFLAEVTASVRGASVWVTPHRLWKFLEKKWGMGTTSQSIFAYLGDAVRELFGDCIAEEREGEYALRVDCVCKKLGTCPSVS